MAKKTKKEDSEMEKLAKDAFTLDDIEALDDQDKSPRKVYDGIKIVNDDVDLEKEFDDSYIEELGPVLSDKEKENNLKIINEELKDLAEGSNLPGDIEGEVEKIFTFEEEPEWADFPEESIKASIDAGEILPELKPRKNAIYRAILISLPKKIISDKGNFFTVEIEIEEMRKSLKANRSFNFALKRYKVKNNVPYSDLVGRKIVFQKDDNGFFVVQIK